MALPQYHSPEVLTAAAASLEHYARCTFFKNVNGGGTMNKPGTPPGFHRVLALIAVEVRGWMEGHQIGTFP